MPHGNDESGPTASFFRSRYDWDEKELGLSKSSTGTKAIVDEGEVKVQFKKPQQNTAFPKKNEK